MATCRGRPLTPRWRTLAAASSCPAAVPFLVSNCQDGLLRGSLFPGPVDWGVSLFDYEIPWHGRLPTRWTTSPWWREEVWPEVWPSHIGDTQGDYRRCLQGGVSLPPCRHRLGALTAPAWWLPFGILPCGPGRLSLRGSGEELKHAPC